MTSPAHIPSPNRITQRLESGQKFNAYDLVMGGFSVALGPVNDRLHLATCESPSAANLIVAALREAFGQPPSLSPAEVQHDEFCSFDMDGVSACDCGAIE